MHLSALLGRPVTTGDGGALARVDDVIVRLRGELYPLVTGLVARVQERRVFVPSELVADWGGEAVVLSAATLNLREFERRSGEVLLRADVLGHRLVDVTAAELVRAYDVELERRDEGLLVSCLDTRRPARLFGLLRQGAGHPCRDWKAFEPLLGEALPLPRSGLARLHRLKPAQLADLIEDANRAEGAEIMHQVHADPELEADVFEELDPDTATRLFGDRSDAEVAEILAHMRADDAADAIAELPQRRRQQLLDALPLGQRAKVLTLLGFNPTSAGGLMNVDVLTLPVEATVGEAIAGVQAARGLQPEALVTVHAVNTEGRLCGVVPLVSLLQTEPTTALRELLDDDPVRVSANTDPVDVALLMADHNLLTIPVVDEDTRLLGVITVDDVLEATVPDDWRRREPPAHPEPPPSTDQPDAAAASADTR